MPETKTAAETLVEGLKKISEGFEQLTKAGMPRDMIKAWLHQKTRVGKVNIDLILNALEELQKEMNAPVRT